MGGSVPRNWFRRAGDFLPEASSLSCLAAASRSFSSTASCPALEAKFSARFPSASSKKMFAPLLRSKAIPSWLPTAAHKCNDVHPRAPGAASMSAPWSSMTANKLLWPRVAHTCKQVRASSRHALAAPASRASASSSSSAGAGGRTTELRPAKFGSASTSSSCFTIRSAPIRHAWYNGERPSSSSMFTRPLLSMTLMRPSTFPPRTAWKSALRPAQSTTSTDAPLSRIMEATSAFPMHKACIKAVQPASSVRFVFAWFSSKRATLSTCPRFAASISDVVLCSVWRSTSALWSSSHLCKNMSPLSAAK
mmetsp:Transcript_24356/g.56589  ORF Transcript_24356/g.56589 Transcript_24356/m.56589 type:complete len:307 (-) Transcript_24356:978-1898(-)